MKQLLVGVVLLLTVGACGISMPSVNVVGSGKTVSETREVSGFHAIQVSGGSEVDIVQGEEEGLVVEADENLIQYLESRVENGTLYLGVKNEDVLANLSFKVIKYHLKVKDLDSISLSGATNLDMASLTTTDLQMNLSGASSVTIDNLIADSLSLESSGASDVNLSGKCPEQVISIDGGGQYKASDLAGKTVRVDASGAAQLEVSASDTLDLNLSGASKVDYYGDPAVTQQSTGASEISAHPAK
jgi:hypothetical protein